MIFSDYTIAIIKDIDVYIFENSKYTKIGKFIKLNPYDGDLGTFTFEKRIVPIEEPLFISKDDENGMAEYKEILKLLAKQQQSSSSRSSSSKKSWKARGGKTKSKNTRRKSFRRR